MECLLMQTPSEYGSRRFCWRILFVLSGSQQLPASPQRYCRKQVCCGSTTAAVMCSEINWLTSLRALSQVKGLTPATRQSQRLQKVDAENVGLVNFPDDIDLRQGEKSSSQAEVKSCQIPGLKTYRLLTSEMPRRSRAAELPRPTVHDKQLHLSLCGQVAHCFVIHNTCCVPILQHKLWLPLAFILRDGNVCSALGRILLRLGL